MQRKIIQLAILPESVKTMSEVMGLCDDGAVMVLSQDGSYWRELPPIPQKPVERDYIGQVNDKLSDAYQEGYAADYNGSPKTLNLYHPTTKEFRQWEKGYIASIKD